MYRPLYVLALSVMLSACASTKQASYHKPYEWQPMQSPSAKKNRKVASSSEMPVYYGEPGVKYKKVCKIEAAGDNFIQTKYTKISDFEPQFKRRAQRCRGANAVIIQNMFAFEHGSAFADGIGIEIDPGS